MTISRLAEVAKERYAGLRWGMLLLFVIGYFATKDHFGEVAIDYLFYNLAALCSCAVLLWLLKFDRRFVAVWLGLIVLIAVYVARFYWIAIDPSPLRTMLPSQSYHGMLANVKQLFEAFRLSVVAFASFSLSAAAMLLAIHENSRIPSHFERRKLEDALHRLTSRLLIFMLPPLMFLLAYVAMRFHIGQMGVEPGDPLPFRLKGVVAYARIVLLPLMLLQLICSAERGGRNALVRIGVLLLMVHGVSDMLIRGSRASLLLSVMLLVFVVASGGLELRRKGVAAVGIFGVLAIAITPVLALYRSLRAQQGLSMGDALFGAFSSLHDAWWSGITKGIEFIFFRLPGVECLWAILSRDAEPLGMRSFGVFFSQNGMAGYLTYQVHQANALELTLYAPGFVGWLYLVAGIPAIVLGPVLIAILSMHGWKWLSQPRWLCGPIMRTFLLWMLFVALTEGTLDGMGFTFLVGVLAVSTLEIGLRAGRRYLENKAKLADG